MAIHSFIFALVFLVMLFVVVASIRRGKSPEAVVILVFSTILAMWSGSFLLYSLKPNILPERLLIGIDLFFSIAAATTHLAFSISHTNRVNQVSRPAIFLFLIEPFITQVILWTPFLRGIFFSGSKPLWMQIDAIYTLMLLGVSIILLMDTFRRGPHKFSQKTRIIIIAGAVIPFIVRLIGSVEMQLDSTAVFYNVAYSLAVLGFYYGSFSAEFLETIPITREDVVEGMADAWMVVDVNNLVVDLNPAAEEVIGMSKNRIFGQPINLILSNWPNLMDANGGPREFDMKRTVKIENDWRYLNTRISKISDRNKKDIGYLIVWRDITDRKLVDDARERSRNELLILLNEISSAASHSASPEEFLTQIIYQIIYPFRSQAVAIYLTKQIPDQEDEQVILLASHVGFAPEQVKVLREVPVTNAMLKWLKKNNDNRPLSIDDVRNDADIPAPIRKMDFVSLALIPLAINIRKEQSTLGYICLARNELQPYSQDELIRLAAISNQIAAIIDNDRRRQSSIVQSERQRLLRDLHDSVSQKLYGLVALTEAAQAALDAGSTINPQQVLEKIGDNARQAVKEMRLFLYEMRPVDLDKESLTSALFYRLAAVEGRSNIKARLLPDDNIEIPKYKETVLFYITQEALNNILRHADAKNVLITLKQNRQSIILQIQDDGKGFDVKKIERGGMGLNNMKERALQIHGKYKMTSKPGEGTNITVTIPKKD